MSARLLVTVTHDNPAARSVADWLGIREHSLDGCLPEQALAVVQQAYADGYEQHAANEFELQGVALGGAGDPLLALPQLQQWLPQFKQQRHGVPITLVSYGLVASSQCEQLIADLQALEIERLELLLPAADPHSYQQLVQPKQQDFSDLCYFISHAAQAGMQVFALIPSASPQRSDCRQLAQALGAQPVLVERREAGE